MKTNHIFLRLKRLLLLGLLLSLLSLSLSACSGGAEKKGEQILQTCGYSPFEVSADSLGTSAQGTIILYEKDKDLLGIRIVSTVCVDPKDWGGVAFYLPIGSTLEHVLCTYPENGEVQELDPVTVWKSENSHGDFNLMLEIDRHHDQKARGGGKGTVVIEAACRNETEGSDFPASLKFAVDCGASFEKGQSIMGLAHREIVVDIKRTEKPHPAQSKP